MARALVVHASRHGASAGIAQRIAEVLQGAGVDTVVGRARDLPDPWTFDACVIGAGVYMGAWVEDGIAYLERYAHVLPARPVWIFSSGPLPHSTKDANGAELDPVEQALGPAQGPGSGGRRKLEAALAPIHPREHRIFAGAFDPSDPPTTMAERVIRMLPMSKGILPRGDFRDWTAIEGWAREIAAELTEPPSVP